MCPTCDAPKKSEEIDLTEDVVLVGIPPVSKTSLKEELLAELKLFITESLAVLTVKEEVPAEELPVVEEVKTESVPTEVKLEDLFEFLLNKEFNL